MTALVNVEVVVLEDGVEVGRKAIRYFPTQPYTVKIDTPDGTDAEIARIAGEETS